MKLQLALNVRDLDEATEYYSKLFNVQPHKIREGYANFSIASPPLKLVLFESPEAEERINHLGVEVSTSEELKQVSQRLQTSGLVDQINTDEICCFATQDKVWSNEPQGIPWEWYLITDDDPVSLKSSQPSPCCGVGH